MGRFTKTWADTVINGRYLVVVGFLLLAGLSVLPMGRLYYDASNERFFLPNDPAKLVFNKLMDLFGDTEYLSVGFEMDSGAGDVFNSKVLDAVEDITAFLENHEYVTQVRSLTRYQYTHSDHGMLSSDTVLEDYSDPEVIENGRDIIAHEEMILGGLISRNFNHTRVVARTAYIENTSAHKVKLIHDLNHFISEQGYDQSPLYHLHISGQPLFNEQFQTMSQRDQAWINPTMAVVMIIILFISFRSISGTLLPWLLIGISITLVSGIQGLMIWPHSVVESALVPSLIIIGVGVSVHVIVEFYHFRGTGLTPTEAARQTIIHLYLPAFYTAFTTAIGFIALSVTELVPVRQFAWLGAIGSMIIFLLSMTLIPAVMSFIPWFSNLTHRVIDDGLITRLAARVPEFSFRYRYPLVIVGAVLAIASMILVPHIQVDSNVVKYFKQSSTIRKDLDYFDAQYNGITNIDVMINSGYPGGDQEPKFLAQVEQLQAWLEAQPESGQATSLIDFYKEINQALHDDDPQFYQLPDSPEMAAQLLFVYENTGPDEDLTDLQDYDQQYLRILLPVKNQDASDTTRFLNRIRDKLSHDFPSLTVQLTGNLVMYNVQERYINKGMFNSFSVALLIIGLSFVVLFRSVKYGVIALIPSVLPIVMTGAILTVLHINLDLGTMIVGAMTMGIAVDDAIHVMNRYLLARKQGLESYQAIERAMVESGRAVIFTSVVLVCGFSLMLLGSFIPYIYVGLFSAIIMILALVGDLIFLPAILHIADGRRCQSVSSAAADL